MPRWYPVIAPGDREYTFDLPQRIRRFYLSQPRFLREDYPPGWPRGGVTEWEFVARGTGFAAGDLFGLAGGTEDAFGKIVVVDAGRVVALEWLGLGTGYRPGEVATYSSPGVGLILLITEVA